MRYFPILVVACVASALLGAQSAGGSAPAETNTDAERQELQRELQESGTSAEDTIRVLEAHIRKYPDSSVFPEVQQLLAKEAIEVNDDSRIIRYGVPTLVRTPNDVNLLDRVSAALLNRIGKNGSKDLSSDAIKEGAEKALDYAKRFEDYVIRIPVPKGSDPVHHQEDHDRALERALLYQSRALAALGNKEESRRKAALAYIAYPEEASAREFAEALDRAGDHQGAVERMAEAFAIPDLRASTEDRAADRKQLAEMYKKLHDGSEAGMGDEILHAYDRTVATLDRRRKQLLPLDPNYDISDPGKFVLEGLEGDKLPLTSLRGKVLILDFWATWCIPCRTQHPLYEQVRKRFESRDDVLFLSINADATHDPVAGFLDAQQWSRAVYFESGLARLLSVVNIPTTIILDKEGRVASRMNGFLPDKFVEQLTSRVQSILTPVPDSVAKQ